MAMKQQIALIGYGAIGAAVHRLLLAHADQVELVAVLVRDRAASQALAPQAAALMVDQLPELLQRQPTLVVECAGHQAVDLYGVAVLQAGVDLLVVSIGALAEPAREAALVQAARAAGKRLLLPAGAIGGVDWLAAARLAGLRQVTYRSRKPARRAAASQSTPPMAPAGNSKRLPAARAACTSAASRADSASAPIETTSKSTPACNTATPYKSTA